MISGQKIQETIKLSENSKFLSLYEKVEKNNKDYKAWKAVLDVLDEESLELARVVYKAFLEFFPSSPKYIKKWINFEMKEHDIKAPETKATIQKIYEDAVEASPYCVGIWKDYTAYVSIHMPKDEAREYVHSLFSSNKRQNRVFRRAISYVGTCKGAQAIWDEYIQFEASTNKHLNVALVYKELLSTPFDKVDKYWEPFEAFSSKLPTELLGDEEELNSIKEEYNQNEKHKLDSDNQRLYNIKQMLLERRKQAFESSVKLAEQFRPFEKELKFDFENNSISEKELSQWNDYLTLKEKVDSEKHVVVLYERALIPLISNATIWTRYLLWSYNHLGVKASIDICRRARKAIPENPSFYIYLLSYLEETQQFEEHSQLLTLLKSNFPNYLEGSLYEFDYMIRQQKEEEATTLLLILIHHQDLTLNDRVFACVYLTHYYIRTRQLEKAREIFEHQQQDFSSSSLFWKCYFQFESNFSSSPATVLPALLSKVLEASVKDSVKIQLYERYVDYMTFIVPIQTLNAIKSEYYEFKQQHQSEQTSLEATVKRVYQEAPEAKRTAVSEPAAPQPIAAQPAVPQPMTTQSVASQPAMVNGQYPTMNPYSYGYQYPYNYYYQYSYPYQQPQQ